MVIRHTVHNVVSRCIKYLVGNGIKLSVGTKTGQLLFCCLSVHKGVCLYRNLVVCKIVLCYKIGQSAKCSCHLLHKVVSRNKNWAVNTIL